MPGTDTVVGGGGEYVVHLREINLEELQAGKDHI